MWRFLKFPYVEKRFVRGEIMTNIMHGLNLKVEPLLQLLPPLFHWYASVVEAIAISHFVPNLAMMMIDDNMKF